MVGLPEELLEKSPFELSGGQKRRVAIAGVMAMEPEVLILDEPTAGLDPGGAGTTFWRNIRAYHRSTEAATMILVSHSMEDDRPERWTGMLVHERRAHVLMQTARRRRCSPGRRSWQPVGLDVPQVTRVVHGAARSGAGHRRRRSTPSTRRSRR